MTCRKRAASAIIFDNEGRVLLAKRAPTKQPFPNTWSLPSTYIEQDQEFSYSLMDAVRRKLTIDIIIEKFLDFKVDMQEDYMLHMNDYIARITKGIPTPNGNDYTEVKYVNPGPYFAGHDRNKMGFCLQVLLRNLDKDPDLWKNYKK